MASKSVDIKNAPSGRLGLPLKAGAIKNMSEAIAVAAMPGSFNEDRTVYAFPTLSYRAARGGTLLWTVRVRLFHDGEAAVPFTPDMLGRPAPPLEGYRGEILVEALQEGGKVRDVLPTYVTEGKNLGKANATNPATQALRDALGLYNKHAKRIDVTEAASAPEVAAPMAAAATRPKTAKPDSKTAKPDSKSAKPDSKTRFDPNPPPQLVKALAHGKARGAAVALTPSDFENGVTVQRKLDGVRNLARLEDGAVLLSSRTGGAYPGQGHIAEDLARLFTLAPPVDLGGFRGVYAAEQLEAYTPPRPYLDGELYKFGKPLNWISGQARRGDDAGELEFHVFDVVFPHAKAAGFDRQSRDRQAYLDDWFARARDAGLDLKHVKRVENFPAASMADIKALAARFLAEGYEGAIIRRDAAGYRYSYSNYHSDNALKFKPKFDDEFPVVGFTQGTRGKDVGALIWVCTVPDPVDPADAEFSTVPKDMSYEDRYRLFACLGQVVGDGKVTRFERDFKGRPLTVEHAGLSAKTGKPLQAKGKIFRTYEEGPDADPVRKALLECGS